MAHPFLSWLEVRVVRWLVRSPRIGLILVKQKDGPFSWVIEDKTDTCPVPRQEEPLSKLEPPSMQLERLYHAPDAER